MAQLLIEISRKHPGLLRTSGRGRRCFRWRLLQTNVEIEFLGILSVTSAILDVRWIEFDTGPLHQLDIKALDIEAFSGVAFGRNRATFAASTFAESQFGQIQSLGSAHRVGKLLCFLKPVHAFRGPFIHGIGDLHLRIKPLDDLVLFGQFLFRLVGPAGEIGDRIRPIAKGGGDEDHDRGREYPAVSRPHAGG
jgi:hypothetical protein